MTKGVKTSWGELSSYDFILQKINSLREYFPSLRNKPDDYVFSALCVKSHFYKNPSLQLSENELYDMIVDGTNDGGTDILLSDPNSEADDLVIAQSKFYQGISEENIRNALAKMVLFFKNMSEGVYGKISEKVQRRFLTLNSEIGEESKIHFVFYTSAPQNRINKERLKKALLKDFTETNNKVEVSILFDSDIVEEIRESESRRPTVESGKILIDKSGNSLKYGEDAVMVNASAFSIKELYAQHFTNLLSMNLRYHIAGKDIDKAIRDTIDKDPESFWYKNNGITILCDDFEIDAKEVKLKNFSIVNGGQTTYVIHRDNNINNFNDLFLPCKIIRILGDNDDEKRKFSFDIAKATNSQKPIKNTDLKANLPEQVRFAQAMREAGLFYQTKRGENIPKDYSANYLNSDLTEIGKLCLCAIFQLPGASRVKPSTFYANEGKYYDTIFSSNQQQVANICRELLYIDHYFRKVFQQKFDQENNTPILKDRIPFAHNSRTICIAFTALAARYWQKNISEEELSKILTDRGNYDILRNLGSMEYLLPTEVFNDKDFYDSILYKLFDTIINSGYRTFSTASQLDPTLNATNYLKRDHNYYTILKNDWYSISKKIAEIFKDIEF